MINTLKQPATVAVILSALLSAPAARAQDDLFQDAGSWLQTVGEGSLKVLDPRLANARIWLEGQSRFDRNWSHWYQGMVRTAIGYSLTDRATIWAGYTWLPTQNMKFNQNINGAYVSQQDVWPAFRYVLPTAVGTVTFRTMFETNFLENNNSSDVRFRPRQMIRLMHPLVAEPRLSLIAWDEFFIRLNTTQAGGQAGFDQNRAFAGLGWTFNHNVRTEVGYMNQYLDDATHSNNTMHHLIMGSVFMNF